MYSFSPQENKLQILMTSQGRFQICVQTWCMLYKYCFIYTFMLYLYNFHNCDQASYDNIQYRKYINRIQNCYVQYLYKYYLYILFMYLYFVVCVLCIFCVLFSLLQLHHTWIGNVKTDTFLYYINNIYIFYLYIYILFYFIIYLLSYLFYINIILIFYLYIYMLYILLILYIYTINFIS